MGSNIHNNYTKEISRGTGPGDLLLLLPKNGVLLEELAPHGGDGVCLEVKENRHHQTNLAVIKP